MSLVERCAGQGEFPVQFSVDRAEGTFLPAHPQVSIVIFFPQLIKICAVFFLGSVLTRGVCRISYGNSHSTAVGSLAPSIPSKWFIFFHKFGVRLFSDHIRLRSTCY